MGKLWIEFFVDDVIIEVGFRPFWPKLLGPGHRPLDGICDSSFFGN